jgi:hypothetical protein
MDKVGSTPYNEFLYNEAEQYGGHVLHGGMDV